MNKEYSMDMSGESGPRSLLEEGWQEFEVVRVEKQTSKKGNEMFKITLALAQSAGIGIEVYAITAPGKRWLLKQLLIACDVEAGQDGVYDWDIEDVEGKTVDGFVENQNETWVDREGNPRTSKKSRISQFKKND